MNSEPAPQENNGKTAIGEWLESIQLGQYTPTFLENGITFEVLRELGEDDLKECGVSVLGHRKLILKKIREQSPENAPIAASMEAAAHPATTLPAAPPMELAARSQPAVLHAGDEHPVAARRNRLQRLASSKVFVFSVILHVLFGIGAAYFIVQRIQAKRVITFQGGPPSPNASTRALEHKMNMSRVKQTMSAPAQAKRITTTGLSTISLPDMPSMPEATEIVPSKMAGMGGAGVGFEPGGMGAGTDQGVGGSVPLFGFNQATGALVGNFYDLKQERNGRPTKMAGDTAPGGGSEDDANKLFADEVTKFCAGGWNDSEFSEYFKGPRPLYATQIFIPRITSDECPKEFKLADRVKPKRWVVHYSGKVIPPESGRYRFVGFGDDILVVKFNGRVVLDAGFLMPENEGRPKNYYLYDGLSPSKDTGEYPGCGIGEYFDVTAGSTYNMDVLIGEWPGGYGKAWILLQKEGVEYDKDSKGNPRLPIFKLAKSGPPRKGGEAPVIGNDTSWSLWRAVTQSTEAPSALDMLKGP